MGDEAEDDLVVMPSGLALQQVSRWLGEPAEQLLEEADPVAEELFDKPRPALLGLGAKYLSHKSMEQSGLEAKLKRRLDKSAAGGEGRRQLGGGGGPWPAQLHRPHEGKRRREDGSGHGQRHTSGGPSWQRRSGGGGGSDGEEDSEGEGEDDDSEGKLRALKQRPAGGGQAGARVLDRQRLLAVPAEHLSKWQRKRMRQKDKAKQQQQQQQQEQEGQQQEGQQQHKKHKHKKREGPG